MKDLHEGVLSLFAEAQHECDRQGTSFYERNKSEVRRDKEGLYARHYRRRSHVREKKNAKERLERKLFKFRCAHQVWNPGKAEPVPRELFMVCLVCGRKNQACTCK